MPILSDLFHACLEPSSKIVKHFELGRATICQPCIEKTSSSLWATTCCRGQCAQLSSVFWNLA